MKDITKAFFKQPKDYGKKANENITRVGMYKNKLKNIYNLLGEKNLMIGIIIGETVAGYRCCNRYAALKLVEVIGTEYFLDISFAGNRKTVLVRVKGKAPEKEKEGSSDKGDKNRPLSPKGPDIRTRYFWNHR